MTMLIPPLFGPRPGESSDCRVYISIYGRIYMAVYRVCHVGVCWSCSSIFEYVRIPRKCMQPLMTIANKSLYSIVAGVDFNWKSLRYLPPTDKPYYSRAEHKEIMRNLLDSFWNAKRGSSIELYSAQSTRHTQSSHLNPASRLYYPRNHSLSPPYQACSISYSSHSSTSSTTSSRWTRHSYYL